MENEPPGPPPLEILFLHPWWIGISTSLNAIPFVSLRLKIWVFPLKSNVFLESWLPDCPTSPRHNFWCMGGCILIIGEKIISRRVMDEGQSGRQDSRKTVDLSGKNNISSISNPKYKGIAFRWVLIPFHLCSGGKMVSPKSLFYSSGQGVRVEK